LLAAGAIVWPWAAALGLLVLSFLHPIGSQWALPFYFSLIVPIAISSLLILHRPMNRDAATAASGLLSC